MKASHMEKRDKSLPAESSPPATSQRRTLETLFRHPSAQNIEWGDALALFEVLGEVEHKDNDKWMLQVGGECQLMHQPHGKDLTGLEVVQLRKFLQRAGWSAKGEMGTPCEATQKPTSFLVVVDHHEANIYHIGADPRDVTRQEIKPCDPHHFLHHLAHKDQDRERGQRAPEDPGFYARIASALAIGGSIVVVGHGTGHSNAAHHLVEHLRACDPDTYARVVREVVADLSSITPAKLLEIAEQTA
ncbi:hypothetical protein [Dyella sp. S184]|uniref:hypothetical protein n=1 Tax=Dyella sp. S184 TaxID=1641862 RepID=UPI00131C2040|nr:hypothetical protein [Dyella sp. S184]